MLSNKFRNELITSLEIVWMTSSSVILIIIFLSIFFPGILLVLSPVCISKSLYSEECLMCGMTRAFVEISNGNISSAIVLNSFSPCLFLLFILNSFVFIPFTYIKLKKLFMIFKTKISIN